MNNIIEAVNRNAAREEEIRKILTETYIGDSTGEDYQAVALLAVEVGIKLFDILLNVRKPNSGLTHKATMDLVVGLNGNPFWSKHGAGLIPLLHTGLQAQADYALLMMEKQSEPNATHSDKLIAQAQLAGLDIFSMLAYLLGGQEFMAMKSLEVKKRLLPYFME